WREAIKSFEAVIRLAPSNSHGHFYLGQAYLSQQRWERAAQCLNKALEQRYPDRQRLVIDLAVAENEAGHPEKALSHLQSVPPPENGPLKAQYYVLTGLAHANLNQPRQAIEAFQRAGEMDDSNPGYRELLISALISTDQTGKALAEAIRAQRKFPDHPEIQFLFGFTSYYVPYNRFTKLALRNLREAQPESPRTVLMEGLVHRKDGRHQEASQAFTLAAERGVPEAFLLLGITAKESGDYAKAERMLLEAEKLNPRNGQALVELGKVYLAQGRVAEALARLQRAEACMPSSSGVQYQLHRVYSRLGQKEKSTHHLVLFQKLQQERAELSQPASKENQ
ncbi:MAG: tetratricopeptide repeat protein, partial [Terriglobia bacterium]